VRRVVDVLLLAVVGAIVAVAAVDALRDDERHALAVSGELVFSDRECGRHVVALPSLASRRLLTEGCGVFTRYDNLGIVAGEVSWFAYPGGTTLVLSQEALRSQVGRHFRVRAVAWLGELRYAAILSGPRELLTIWEGPSMIRVVRRLHPLVGELRASRSGRFFAAGDGKGRLLVFDRDGDRVAAPNGRAIAWSPDERFVAIATEGAVVVLRVGGRTPLVRLPVRARDLDWRL
jgi:hypothetical protein